MELDDLKKSWNKLDEHLKDKRFINDEDIKKLINHTQNGITGINRFNKRLRYVALIALAVFALILSFTGRQADIIYYQTLFLLCIPALVWDIFSTRYLVQTKIDEMPIIKVIARVNRYRRWVIRERFVAVVFVLVVSGLFFLQKHLWQTTAGAISYIAVWAASILLLLWIYRNELGQLREIKKNLEELKELKNDNSLTTIS